MGRRGWRRTTSKFDDGITTEGPFPRNSPIGLTQEAPGKVINQSPWTRNQPRARQVRGLPHRTEVLARLVSTAVVRELLPLPKRKREPKLPLFDSNRQILDGCPASGDKAHQAQTRQEQGIRLRLGNRGHRNRATVAPSEHANTVATDPELIVPGRQGGRGN